MTQVNKGREEAMSTLKKTIDRTGCSPVSRVSWSDEDLAALRAEGAHKIQQAATQRWAQFDLHLDWPGLFDLVTDKQILSELTDIFGDDCFQLVETRLYPKRPGAGIEWHIDVWQLLYYEPNLAGRDSEFHSVTIWLALDDVPTEMGPIQMVHYKHVDLERLVRLRRNHMLDRYKAACEAEARRQGDLVQTLPMKAGEYVMFDPRNLHTGAPNRTDRPRLGIVLRYCARHVRVDPRFSKKGALKKGALTIVRIENGRPIRPESVAR
jgi:ectoine hydroxylase-related dioxygenase (phytanoyl-CoA dioxygenase family)